MSAVVTAPLVVGRLGAAYGVRGWLHVHSFLDPKAALMDYSEWLLAETAQAPDDEWSIVEIEQVKQHNRGLVVRLVDCATRERAEELTGLLVALPRAMLPAASDDEDYWCHLLDAAVQTQQGVSLGSVDSMLETGANDVMVVRSGDVERLIPFVIGKVITSVDLDARVIVVDWDPDWGTDADPDVSGEQ